MLTAGSRLGPYEVVAPLGAGGMGEVYRARDTRIGREVAVKVLPAAFAEDKDRMQRFEREARAAGSLNHPNLLTLFDVGTHEGSPYLVTELLEGTTLRMLLKDGPLPLRKATDYGVQIARGLAAAHDHGVLHRDLKPENLFVTLDGRAKVLDFGLAKLVRPRDGDAVDSVQSTSTSPTGAGVLLGTVGYMSPEQVRAQPTDARSDLFALGAVLYEMLSGRRAFEGDSTVETLNAILKQDPPEITGTSPHTPPGVERIVRRCLEKAPGDRFRSAADLAFALEGLSSASSTGVSRVGEDPSRRRRRLAVGGGLGLLAVACGTAMLFLGERLGASAPPVYHRLNFRRGIVYHARFAPDGRTVVYSASWDGEPFRFFVARVDHLEFQNLGLPPAAEWRPLDLPEGIIFAISSTGEMALGLGEGGTIYPRTLARAALGGGPPREVMKDVVGADWSPDGKDLAVIRYVGNRSRLEYPLGHVLREGNGLRWPRVSPQGDKVAFMEPVPGDSAHRLCVVDRSGRNSVLAAGTGGVLSLAWAPGGREILVSWRSKELVAVSLSGRTRRVATFAFNTAVMDVASDGRVLVASGDDRQSVVALAPGAKEERDVSTTNQDNLGAVSRDGATVAINSWTDGGPKVLLQRTDGSGAALRLGEGRALALSPDGQWVFVQRQGGTQHVLVSIGAGDERLVDLRGIETDSDGGGVEFLSDRRLVLMGHAPAKPWRVFRVDVEAGPPQPLTPEGTSLAGASPDGRRIAALDDDGAIWIYPLEGGEGRLVPGPPEKGSVGPWSSDGKSIFVADIDRLKWRIFRRDVATGRREFWREFKPADPAGVWALEVTPGADGSSYFYQCHRWIGSLFIIEGLR